MNFYEINLSIKPYGVIPSCGIGIERFQDIINIYAAIKQPRIISTHRC